MKWNGNPSGVVWDPAGVEETEIPETSTRFGSGTRWETVIGWEMDAENNVDAISHVNSVVYAIDNALMRSGKWVSGRKSVWARLEMGREREKMVILRKWAVNGLRTYGSNGRRYKSGRKRREREKRTEVSGMVSVLSNTAVNNVCMKVGKVRRR